MTPLITPDQAIAIALVFSRIIAFFMAFPLLNANLIPLNVRVLLVIAFSFVVILQQDLSISVSQAELLVFTLLVLKEVLIGFSLGLITTIFVSIFLYAAEIVSYFMGFTIVNVFNPAFGQTSVLSAFFLILFYLLFFVSGAYQIVIGSLFKSFELLPVINFTFNDRVFPYILGKSGDIFKLGFQIAFAFSLVLIVFNVVLALINRLIPQINISFVGLPAQILIGFIVLLFGADVLVKLGISLVDSMVSSIIELLKILSR